MLSPRSHRLAAVVVLLLAGCTGAELPGSVEQETRERLARVQERRLEDIGIPSEPIPINADVNFYRVAIPDRFMGGDPDFDSYCYVTSNTRTGSVAIDCLPWSHSE